MKINLNYPFIRNLFFTTIIGGLVGLLNYAFNITIARYTTTALFGIYSSALGFINLLQMPAFAIQALITKNIAQHKDKDLNHYKWNSLLHFAILGIVTAFILLLTRNWIGKSAAIPSQYFYSLAFTCLIAFVSPVAKGLLLGTEKIKTYNLTLLGETMGKFIIGIIAINNGSSLHWLILANSIPASLSTLIIILAIKFPTSTGARIKNNYKDLSLISISFILLTLPFTVDLILVNSAFKAEYATISLLGKIIYHSAITSASVLFAHLANEKSATKQVKNLLFALGLSLAIASVLLIIFFTHSSQIINLTVGSQYISIGKYLGPYGLCMLGFSLSYNIEQYLIAQSNFKFIYPLLFCNMLQISLFLSKNNSLASIMQNQYLVYTLITISSIYLLINEIMSKRKNLKC